mgnify:FL=1
MQTSNHATLATHFLNSPNRPPIKQSTGAVQAFKRVTTECYIRDNWRAEFAWGKNDCLLFVSNFLIALGHPDYARDVRERYRSKEGAETMLRMMGFFSVAECVSSYLKPKPLKAVERGDVVMYSSNCLGIFSGNVSHFMLPEKGLIGLRSHALTHAWESSCAT